MYSSVSARTREIATLRALGFGSGAVVVSVMIESLALGALGGGIGVAPFEILLGLLVLAQSGVRNGQLADGDGVLGNGAGGLEVGILQIEGERNPPVGTGRGGTYFHRSARFPAARDEDGDGVIVGLEILEGEAAGGVALGGGGEGTPGGEYGDGGAAGRQELTGKVEERVGSEGRRCEHRGQEKTKHAPIRLYRQCGDDAIPVKTTVQKKDYGACSRYELETEDVTGFEVAGFVGEAAHPERDSAMVLNR